MSKAEMYSLLLLRRILTEEVKTTLSVHLFSISKAGEGQFDNIDSLPGG